MMIKVGDGDKILRRQYQLLRMQDVEGPGKKQLKQNLNM